MIVSAVMALGLTLSASPVDSLALTTGAGDYTLQCDAAILPPGDFDVSSCASVTVTFTGVGIAVSGSVPTPDAGVVDSGPADSGLPPDAGVADSGVVPDAGSGSSSGLISYTCGALPPQGASGWVTMMVNSETRYVYVPFTPDYTFFVDVLGAVQDPPVVFSFHSGANDPMETYGTNVDPAWSGAVLILSPYVGDGYQFWGDDVERNLNLVEAMLLCLPAWTPYVMSQSDRVISSFSAGTYFSQHVIDRFGDSFARGVVFSGGAPGVLSGPRSTQLVVASGARGVDGCNSLTSTCAGGQTGPWDFFQASDDYVADAVAAGLPGPIRCVHGGGHEPDPALVGSQGAPYLSFLLSGDTSGLPPYCN